MKIPDTSLPIGRPATLAVRAFVGATLAFLGRGVAALTIVDEVAREEVLGLPEPFLFAMDVAPHGPSMRLARRGDRLVVDHGSDRPTLTIRFKHLRHAARVFSLLETTPQAVAHQRLIVDGDLAAAMRIQRLLDRTQEILLPPPIARRALDRASAIPAADRARLAVRLLAQILSR
jgi:hypothetical protein